MISTRLLGVIRDVLEQVISDPEFIDTTSGGDVSPEEAEKLRKDLDDASAAVTTELRMEELRTFVRKVGAHPFPEADYLPESYTGVRRYLLDFEDLIREARRLQR